MYKKGFLGIKYVKKKRMKNKVVLNKKQQGIGKRNEQ